MLYDMSGRTQPSVASEGSPEQSYVPSADSDMVRF